MWSNCAALDQEPKAASSICASLHYMDTLPVTTSYVSNRGVSFPYATTRSQGGARQKGVSWRFIPKRAPWYKGLRECLIGLTNVL